jgi:phosphate transport system permease protein
MIVYRGLEVFWPRRIELVTVRDGAPAALRGSRTLAGMVVRVEEKTSPEQRGQREIQFYVGNRDAYDLSFVYVDERDIAAREQPADLMLVERVENGFAMGMPLRVERKDAAAFAVGEAGFAARLRGLIDEAAARRAAILAIEKDRIGAVNRAMKALALERHREPERAAAIDAEVASRQAQYDALAAEAKELRARQEQDVLVLKLATGEERAIALGQVIDAHFPNRLGFAARVGRFASGFWGFLSDNPREANTEGGIFPAIFGTFVMTLLMSVVVVPFGVVAAIYLREYARQGAWVRAVRIAVNNLAGVPSIVFGVFGVGFFVYFVGGGIDSVFFKDRVAATHEPVFGTGGVLWAAATLALMTVPVVIVATEEAIAAVPRGMKEGSLACGASKWQTIQRIVLPASAPGILTGLVLAMARGAGEVAPLMLVGVIKLAPSLPIDGIWKDTDVIPFVHLDQKFMHLGFHIYDLGFQSPDSDAARPMVFATTLFLIVLVVVLNLGAILIRERLRRRAKLGAF